MVISTKRIRTSKRDKGIALSSYNVLTSHLNQNTGSNIRLALKNSKEEIIVPASAVQLLGDILKAMADGNAVSVVPHTTELTTQSAAKLLGCSRPHVVKLLKQGILPYTMVGKHRRVSLQEVLRYQQRLKKQQKKALVSMMQLDEQAGLYET